jgi:transcriptional regulator with XRE-family HTH domain
MRHNRNGAGPQPSRPAGIHLATLYGVQVRNTGRDTWAALVTDVREAANMSKVELARRLGVDRATISRWEQGLNRPEQADVVKRFADLFAIDLEDALAAAGLRPTDTPQREHAPMDPDVLALMRMLADPDTPEATKAQIRTMMRALLDLAEAQPKPPRRRKATG